MSGLRYVLEEGALLRVSSQDVLLYLGGHTIGIFSRAGLSWMLVRFITPIGSMDSFYDPVIPFVRPNATSLANKIFQERSQV
jgi:hypothetical protein